MRRKDTATLVIDASPGEVYDALIDPDALVAWLPPGDMTGRLERFDARPGGSYRMVLTYPNAASGLGKTTDDSDVINAHFVDLVDGVRVVQEVDFISDDPAFSGTIRMTWEIDSVDSRSRVQITAENVPDGISEEDHLVGMSSTLAQLASYLGG
jgi:uncharacterized protein YndB with AHSA1/START domain